jgi:hypothetical protein
MDFFKKETATDYDYYSINTFAKWLCLHHRQRDIKMIKRKARRKNKIVLKHVLNEEEISI